MKSNRPLWIVIICLLIWNIFLTVDLRKNRKNETSVSNINEYLVSGFSTDFTRVVSKNKSSIVTIEAGGRIGTGFIYRQEDDLSVEVITAYHVVENNDFVKLIFASGFEGFAEILGYDPYTDIAVLKAEIPFEVSPLALGDSSLLNEGEFIISIGTPYKTSYAGSVEVGMVSSALRTINNEISFDETSESYYLDVLQLSSNLHPGYSGGPLLNMNGEVIAVSTMKDSDSIVFALPVNEMKLVAEKILTNEEVHKTNLKVKGRFISSLENYEKIQLDLGLEVTDGLYVESTSDPRYSLKAKDVILSINDVKLHDHDDLLNILYSFAEELNFSVLREGEIIEYTVALHD